MKAKEIILQANTPMTSGLINGKSRESIISEAISAQGKIYAGAKFKDLEPPERESLMYVVAERDRETFKNQILDRQLSNSVKLNQRVGILFASLIGVLIVLLGDIPSINQIESLDVIISSIIGGSGFSAIFKDQLSSILKKK